VAARQHGDALVAQLAGIGSREDALQWRGAGVSVPRAALPDPGEDEVYWADLVGLAVVNRQGVALGTVAAVEDHGAHGILRVTAAEPGTEERLIPFVAAYVDSVDLAARRIEVDWGTDY
jgi:16S rRNA processing protein RimM